VVPVGTAGDDDASKMSRGRGGRAIVTAVWATGSSHA
jgi:hypothetical protein